MVEVKGDEIQLQYGWNDEITHNLHIFDPNIMNIGFL